MSVVVEARVSRGKRIVLPSEVAEAAGLRDGQVVRVVGSTGRVVIEPVAVPDPVTLALKGRKLGYVDPEELEEESVREQERLAGPTS